MKRSDLEILLQEGEGTRVLLAPRGDDPEAQPRRAPRLFRVEGVIRFDRSLCPKFRYPQDFDREKYNSWLRLSGISGRPRIEDVLVNIEAAERSGGRLIFRNAGVLFFARNVRRFFSQAYITCLLAKGTDKVHILDRKDLAGGVVADIEESLRFIERNTRTAYRIERLQRDEIPEYPVAALREAITNAVMHRDWFNEGANVLWRFTLTASR
jgi:ATP-dependent DNA helicase RecG